MVSMTAWLVIFWASGLVQGAGLCLSAWWLYKASHPGWRLFWGTFCINWFITLSHHAIWSWETDFAIPLSFLQNMAKLGAMLAEIVVMQVGHDLERPGEGRY